MGTASTESRLVRISADRKQVCRVGKGAPLGSGRSRCRHILGPRSGERDFGASSRLVGATCGHSMWPQSTVAAASWATGNGGALRDHRCRCRPTPKNRPIKGRTSINVVGAQLITDGASPQAHHHRPRPCACSDSRSVAISSLVTLYRCSW